MQWSCFSICFPKLYVSISWWCSHFLSDYSCFGCNWSSFCKVLYSATHCLFDCSHDLMPLLAQNNTLSSDTFPYIQCHISHYHSATWYEIFCRKLERNNRWTTAVGWISYLSVFWSQAFFPLMHKEMWQLLKKDFMCVSMVLNCLSSAKNIYIFFFFFICIKSWQNLNVASDYTVLIQHQIIL